jgi:hypothetical protein
MGRTVRQSYDLQMGRGSTTAVIRLNGQGILLSRWAEKPFEDPPSLPKDVTSVSDKELMGLLQKLTAWRKYLGMQVALAIVDERYADRTMTSVTALKGYDFRKVDSKERAWNDADYTGAEKDQADAYSYRKLIEALYENVDNDGFIVSREITRRGNVNANRRSDRYS